MPIPKPTTEELAEQKKLRRKREYVEVLPRKGKSGGDLWLNILVPKGGLQTALFAARNGVTSKFLLNLIFYIIITPVIGLTLTKIMFISENDMIMATL